ncbi:diacylglycerol/polyprenol kinase family protein [Methanolapillus millepedarum]|uniref:Phytol kinase n=1 Tax=Methanolapillus millepedarum TaxID=3028296 RepID=A0AA96ZUH8_9EURY|nr:Phytol kinase [Methanosarcinaceae archaeon Ac7]
MSDQTPPEKKFSYRQEVKRKLLHMTSFVFVIFIYLTNKETACLVIGFLFIALVIAEQLCRIFPALNDIKIKYFSPVLRENEKSGNVSSVWFLLGCFLSVLLFSKEVAMLGITILIFGDAFAALIGKRFGKHKFKNGKSLEGTLGFIGVSLLFLIAYAFILDLSRIFIILSVISIVAAAIVEIYTKQLKADDNLTIPLTFGISMWILTWIFTNVLVNI